MSREFDPVVIVRVTDSAEESIRRSLDSLRLQGPSPHVILLNGTGLSLRGLVDFYSKVLELVYVEDDLLYDPYSARLKGFELATTEPLMMLDEGCEMLPGFLDNLRLCWSGHWKLGLVNNVLRVVKRDKEFESLRRQPRSSPRLVAVDPVVCSSPAVIWSLEAARRVDRDHEPRLLVEDWESLLSTRIPPDQIVKLDLFSQKVVVRLSRGAQIGAYHSSTLPALLVDVYEKFQSQDEKTTRLRISRLQRQLVLARKEEDPPTCMPIIADAIKQQQVLLKGFITP